MDEIIIEEKRYISSKQAAKITGYAKDYIGQLCREGRVPARLVGRSWYVLDSAIQDHRFGNPVIESDEKAAPEPSNIETARYSSPAEEVLPSINQLKAAPKASAEEPVQENSVEPLQDSWRSWFEKVEEAATEAIAASHTVPEEQLAAEEPIEESIEVNVPVRAIHHSLYQPVEDEPMPLVIKSYAHDEEELEEQIRVQERPQRGIRGILSGIQVASIMVAAISVIVAVMGSGYFDSYIISNKQVSLVAGVSLYNK